MIQERLSVSPPFELVDQDALHPYSTPCLRHVQRILNQSRSHSRVVLKCIIQPRIVASGRTDNQSFKIRIYGRSSETESKSLSQMMGGLSSKEGEAIEF